MNTAQFSLLLALIASCAASSDDETKLIGQRPKIILFGDSITQQSTGTWGWATLLTDAYSRKADVIVRGFNGYTTDVARCVCLWRALAYQDDD
eukprot:192308-Hanusia_phi.AAC.1